VRSQSAAANASTGWARDGDGAGDDLARLCSEIVPHADRAAADSGQVDAVHVDGVAATREAADALAVYRETRKLLVDELGIEPSASLRELEKAILEHDPSLKPGGAAAVAAAQPLAIVVVVRDDTRAGDLLSIAESLTHGSERELIIVRLLTADADVTAATAALTAQREALVAHGGCRCGLLSERRRSEGLGNVRAAVASRAGVPTLRPPRSSPRAGWRRATR
jgi:hypothetical protein